MPVRELTALRREAAQIRESIGAVTGLRPVYVLVEPDGSESGPVDLKCSPTEPGPEAVTFRVLADPFRLLAQGRRHTSLPHGRGAGISTTLAYYCVGLALTEPARILCAREIQISSRDSVYFLLRSIIERDSRLSEYFEIQRDSITGRNGSEFSFRGVRTHTAAAIKSTEGLRYLWAEESQSLGRESIETVTHTVREHGSRCFWSWNPTHPRDPIGEEFAEDRADVAKPSRPFTLAGNPLASDTLRTEAELLRQRDMERYSHIIGGAIRTYSESRVFGNWYVSPEPLDADAIIAERIANIRIGYKGDARARRDRQARARQRIENAFAVGCDFGFVDPFVIVLACVDHDTNRLFVLPEYVRRGLDPAGMAAAALEFPLPSPRWPIYADHARPELIRYLQKAGLNVHPSVKLPLLERIDGLSRFDIIVDPSCEQTAHELGLYSWATDAQGVVIGDRPEDRDNHCIDALAYGLGEQLKAKPPGQYARLRSTFM